MNVLSITLNPAIDIVYEVNAMELGKSNRVDKAYYSPGGKGNNVARVLNNVNNGNITIMGFAGGSRGQWLENQLVGIGLKVEMVHTSSETRQCIAVASDGETTELLESHFAVSEKEENAFLEKLEHVILKEKISLANISGSFPKGVSTPFLIKMLQICHDNGVDVIIDSSDPRLKKLLSQRPKWIKPNKAELEIITDRTIDSVEDAQSAAEALVQLGAQNVFASLGAEGLLLVSDSGDYYCEPHAIDVQSTVGAGDAAVAGILSGVSEGKDGLELLREAAAFGMASTQESRAGEVRSEVIREMKQKVKCYEC